MSNERRLKSAGPLTQLYRYNRNISRTKERIFDILCKETSRGVALDRERSMRLENVRSRMTRLTLKRNDELMRIYSDPAAIQALRQASPKRPKSSRSQSNLRLKPIKARLTRFDLRPPSPFPQVRVSNITFNDNQIQINMNIPLTNINGDDKSDSKAANDDDIIYPDGVFDHRPYQTVANYRRTKNESVDFKTYPLKVGVDQTETAIIGLDNFAQNHHCELIFTTQEHRFDNSIYRAACGVADLGSIHLLAMDAMQTATFTVVMNFDINDEFHQSEKEVETFVMNFCEAVASVVGCEKNHVRLFSISKMEKEMKKSELKFGITTPELKKTEKYADQLKISAQSGFGEEKILQKVIAKVYEYTWESAVKYLRLHPSDLDHQFDFDYRNIAVGESDIRGNHPYYLPVGWYRLGLRVLHKYDRDRVWIDRENKPGEWPVAFHGTKSDDVLDTVREGVRANPIKYDPMRNSAVAVLGEKVDRPGLYVYTKCENGAANHSEPFTLTILSGESKRFRLVFQCRSKPEKYTVHQTPVEDVDTWRYVDAHFIRPYGILLKEEVEEK